MSLFDKSVVLEHDVSELHIISVVATIVDPEQLLKPVHSILVFVFIAVLLQEWDAVQDKKN